MAGRSASNGPDRGVYGEPRKRTAKWCEGDHRVAALVGLAAGPSASAGPRPSPRSGHAADRYPGEAGPGRHFVCQRRRTPQWASARPKYSRARLQRGRDRRVENVSSELADDLPTLSAKRRIRLAGLRGPLRSRAGDARRSRLGASLSAGGISEQHVTLEHEPGARSAMIFMRFECRENAASWLELGVPT